MKTSVFFLPAIGTKQEIMQGSAGLRSDLYDRMLAELSEQAVLADDAGYESISFTEHHFHIEGLELSNNPVLLDLYIAMQTKRIKVGQLGIVLPAENPIRVAENIAMLDHMTGGRACAGFARGYQRRWVDVLAQQTHGIHGATPDAPEAIDTANRAAFEECFEIIIKCWTEDMLSYQGKYWKIPPGETPWDVETTNLYGAGVENGVLKEVCVLPKPVQKPHPELFQPFSATERSIRWCAQKGVVAVLPPVHPKLEKFLIEVYAEESGKPLGKGIAVLRNLIIAETDEEALALAEDSATFARNAWFEPFGFGRGLDDPDTGERYSFENMFKNGYMLVGSVDTVKRQFEAIQERLPVEWIFAWCYTSLLPHKHMMNSLDWFATKVNPNVGGE